MGGLIVVALRIGCFGAGLSVGVILGWIAVWLVGFDCCVSLIEFIVVIRLVVFDVALFMCLLRFVVAFVV